MKINERIILLRIKLKHFIKLFKGNKDITLFLIMLFLSSFFWLLTTLNKEHFAEVKYKITYLNLPSDRVLLKPLPEYFYLNIKARGYDIISNKLNFSIKSLKIDYKNIIGDIKFKDNRVIEKSVASSSFSQVIKNQLKHGSELYGIRPQFIDFVLCKSASKKVVIRPNLTLSYANQHILRDKVKLTYDSVQISGNSLIVDTISAVFCRPQTFDNLSLDKVVKLELIKYPNVKYSKIRNLEATLTIEKFTEAKILVPISIINKPDSVKVNLFPSKCEITYNVGVSKYEQVNSLLFYVTVDYNNLSNNSNIKLVSYPNYITIKKYSPKQIDYLIEKVNGNI